MSSTTTDDNNNHPLGSSGEITSTKKECTSCEQNTDTITEGFNSVTIRNDMSTCACCGKEGNSDDMNTCNKCKSVKYCNAACKKKHRSKHKKACEKRVAELRDEQLFKDPPPNEECPICFLPQQCGNETEIFKSCCGKVICIGCVYAMKMSEGKDICAYCRAPPPTSDEERIKRTKKLMDKGNARAFYNFAGYYAKGDLGFSRDWIKANELLLMAGERGCAVAYYNLGSSYYRGDGFEVVMKKTKHYYELAAIGGYVQARYYLGNIELKGHPDRAMKHYLLAARAGYEEALDQVKLGFQLGVVTKDGYANTLRAYHERQKEMKSDMREKAAALHVS